MCSLGGHRGLKFAIDVQRLMESGGSDSEDEELENSSGEEPEYGEDSSEVGRVGPLLGFEWMQQGCSSSSHNSLSWPITWIIMLLGELAIQHARAGLQMVTLNVHARASHAQACAM